MDKTIELARLGSCINWCSRYCDQCDHVKLCSDIIESSVWLRQAKEAEATSPTLFDGLYKLQQDINRIV